MAKKKPEKEQVLYGVTTMMGGEDRPLHATVTRNCEWAHIKHTLSSAVKQAHDMNTAEIADQELEYKKYMDVFDTERPEDFAILQRIKRFPKYRCGQKVFVVHARTCDVFAAKGVIVSMDWDNVLREWQYTVLYRGRIRRSFQQGEGPLHELTLCDLEANIFPYEQKAKARKLLMSGVDKCRKWWPKFMKKLSKLKEGDLDWGETL